VKPRTRAAALAGMDISAVITVTMTGPSW
jgi:hypothetical protein